VAYSVASRAGAIVTAIDLNADNIAKARRLFQHPNLVFIHGDALKDLPSQAFDAIVLSNLLEHIADRVNFLANVQAQIHPKRWLIRVPLINRDWRVPLRKELGLFHFSDPTHHTEYTQESFEDEMRQAGLRVVELRINWGEIWAEATDA
jgi:2-polyprenyl-3-methyl-5-hydroxy-6-metoxy-1,4-benzoquinol methylase